MYRSPSHSKRPPLYSQPADTEKRCREICLTGRDTQLVAVLSTLSSFFSPMHLTAHLTSPHPHLTAYNTEHTTQSTQHTSPHTFHICTFYISHNSIHPSHSLLPSSPPYFSTSHGATSHRPCLLNSPSHLTSHLVFPPSERLRILILTSVIFLHWTSESGNSFTNLK